MAGKRVRDSLTRFGASVAPNAIHGATVPSCTVCAGGPVLSGPLAAAGFMGPALVLHQLLWIFAPLNAVLLRLSFGVHRDPLPLAVGGLGSLLLFLHMLSPYVLPAHSSALTDPLRLVSLTLTWLGSPLLLLGAALDWRARRRGARCAAEDYWRVVLLGQHPGLRRGRALFRLLPRDPRCTLCLAPFAGPFVPVMRLLGKSRSRKNPRFCGDCLAEIPLGGAEIEATLIFADVRGSTPLAERLGATEFSRLINRFYSATAEALTAGGALIIDFVGDEVVGLYVPGFAGPRHAAKAIEACREVLRLTGHTDPAGPWVPVGIGLHTAVVFVGAAGSPDGVADIRALGDAVHVTARLASSAAAGEALITEAAVSASGLDLDGLERRRLPLKGLTEPMMVRVLSVQPEMRLSRAVDA
jgi:adenylate cyclase